MGHPPYLSQERVIEQFKEINGDRFDYSKVRYNGGSSKVEILCKEHGIFLCTPSNHKKGRGCPKCKGSRISESSKNNQPSNNEIINSLIEVHGTKYDYSKFRYKNSKTPSVIICPEHGEFLQTASNHKRNNCPKCSLLMTGKKNTSSQEYIIEKFKKVHKDKYDYLLVRYVTARVKVQIICKKHGVFIQTPADHYSGYGCPECGGRRKKTLEEVILKCNEVHKNKYDYSKVEYYRGHTKMIVVCPNHGEFETSYANHSRGKGCPKCIGRNLTTEEWIERFNKIHNFKYNYDLFNFINSQVKIEIVCPIHGVFKQLIRSHLKGAGCNKCHTSKGESLISSYFKNKNIEFEFQKRFEDCKYKKILPFDFYIPKYNSIIEYQGIQHYESVLIFGGDNKFVALKIRDDIKKEYCKNKGIYFLEIRYDEDVEERLNSFLKENNHE